MLSIPEDPKNLHRNQHNRGQAGAVALQAALELGPGLRKEELTDAWREGLRAQRSALTSLFRDNIITEGTYASLVADVDFALANPENNLPELQSRLEGQEQEAG